MKCAYESAVAAYFGSENSARTPLSVISNSLPLPFRPIVLPSKFPRLCPGSSHSRAVLINFVGTPQETYTQGDPDELLPPLRLNILGRVTFS